MATYTPTVLRPANNDELAPRSVGEAIRVYWTTAAGYQKLLYLCGIVLLLSAFFHTGVLFVTGGSLDGDVSWRKPIVFGEAFGVTCISLAWVMTFLSKRRVLGWSLAVLFGVASLGEVALITMQQWRGVPSHFNTSTPFDAAVFNGMGMFVLVLEFVIVAMAVWSYFPMKAPNSLKWAIRAGMVMLVVAQIFGNLIVRNGSNMFGAAGAMKIPHALSLHALQILSLLVWLLLFTNASPRRQTRVVLLGAVGYSGVVAVSTYQTFSGLTLLDLSAAPGLLLGISLVAFTAAGIMTLRSLLAVQR